MIRAGLRTRTPGSAPAATPTPRHRRFLNTYAVTATNPKGVIFYLAFLPQFLDATSPAAAQLLVLAATFVTLAIINATLYVTFAGGAARLLTSETAGRVFNLGGGSLLSAAGIWTAVARRSM